MMPSEDLGPAMRRLKKALEARMRADDRREKAGARRRKAEGGLVSYDMEGLALVLRPALEWDGRGWRAISAEIGVTSPDLSRVMARQDISAAKVFAICDWLRIDPRRFYRPLRGKRPTFRGPRVGSTSSPSASRTPLPLLGGEDERPSATREAGGGAEGDARGGGGCFTGKALKRRVAE